MTISVVLKLGEYSRIGSKADNNAPFNKANKVTLTFHQMQYYLISDVLLQTRMGEPCFNTLRTKHQLGYTVYSKNYDTNGVIGIGIVIEYQANKFRYL